MIYKIILAIYILSWIHMIVETAKTWKRDKFIHRTNVGKTDIIKVVIVITLMIILILCLSPLMMVYFEYNKFKDRTLGGTLIYIPRRKE